MVESNFYIFFILIDLQKILFNLQKKPKEVCQIFCFTLKTLINTKFEKPIFPPKLWKSMWKNLWIVSKSQ